MSNEIKINLDGKDYLVEAGTNLLEFIQPFAITNRWDQFKHVIHAWLKSMEILPEHVEHRLNPQ